MRAKVAVFNNQRHSIDISGNGFQTSPAFEALANAQHIFLEPAPLLAEFSEASTITSSHFNLLDTYGQRVFCGFEKRQKRQFCGNAVKLALVDGAGSEVMSLSGPIRYVAIRDSSLGIIGYVSEVQSLLPVTSSFHVQDRNGHLAFKILRDRTSASQEFTVHGSDMVKIGRVGKFWGKLPDSSVDLSNSFGISFPTDMHTGEKALLVGGLVTIYWKYYGDKNRDRRLATNAWCCMIWCFLFALLIIFALAVLAAYIIHPIPH